MQANAMKPGSLNSNPSDCLSVPRFRDNKGSEASSPCTKGLLSNLSVPGDRRPGAGDTSQPRSEPAKGRFLRPTASGRKTRLRKVTEYAGR